MAGQVRGARRGWRKRGRFKNQITSYRDAYATVAPMNTQHNANVKRLNVFPTNKNALPSRVANITRDRNIRERDSKENLEVQSFGQVLDPVVLGRVGKGEHSKAGKEGALVPALERVAREWLKPEQSWARWRRLVAEHRSWAPYWSSWGSIPRAITTPGAEHAALNVGAKGEAARRALRLLAERRVQRWKALKAAYRKGESVSAEGAAELRLLERDYAAEVEEWREEARIREAAKKLALWLPSRMKRLDEEHAQSVRHEVAHSRKGRSDFLREVALPSYRALNEALARGDLHALQDLTTFCVYGTLKHLVRAMRRKGSEFYGMWRLCQVLSADVVRVRMLNPEEPAWTEEQRRAYAAKEPDNDMDVWKKRYYNDGWLQVTVRFKTREMFGVGRAPPPPASSARREGPKDGRGMHTRDVESCWVFERPAKGRAHSGPQGGGMGLPRAAVWRVCARLEDGPRPPSSEGTSAIGGGLPWYERMGGWDPIASAGQVALEDLEQLDAVLEALPVAVRGCTTPKFGPAAQARVKSAEVGLLPRPKGSAWRGGDRSPLQDQGQSWWHRGAGRQAGRRRRVIDIDPDESTRKRKVVVDTLGLDATSRRGGMREAATSR